MTSAMEIVIPAASGLIGALAGTILLRFDQRREARARLFELIFRADRAASSGSTDLYDLLIQVRVRSFAEGIPEWVVADHASHSFMIRDLVETSPNGFAPVEDEAVWHTSRRRLLAFLRTPRRARMCVAFRRWKPLDRIVEAGGP